MAKRKASRHKTSTASPRGPEPIRKKSGPHYDPIARPMDRQPGMAGSVARIDVNPPRAKIDTRPARMESIRRLNDAHEVATRSTSSARPNRVNSSDFGSLSRTKANTKKHVSEPVRSPQQKEVRDVPTCKERPKHNRGNGGSRAFVPWCGRRG